MEHPICSKECMEYICKGLSGLLPEYFRLHFKLLEIAEPTTKEINCSLDKLAQTLNYNHYVLYCYLAGLKEFKFIRLPRIHDFSQKVRIKILVSY